MAGMDHMYQPIDINLLQLRPEQKSEASILPVLLLAVVIVGAGVLGWLWFSAHSDVKRLNENIAQVDTQISTIAAQLEANSALTGIAQLIHLPEKLTEGKLLTTLALEQLNKLLPAEANLASIAFEEEGGVRLSGVFASTETIISFTQALAKDDTWELVEMSGLSAIETEGTQPGVEDSAQDTQPLPGIQASFVLKPIASVTEGGEA